MNKTLKKNLIYALRTEFIFAAIALIAHIFKAIIMQTNLFVVLGLIIVLGLTYGLQYKLNNPDKPLLEKLFD